MRASLAHHQPVCSTCKQQVQEVISLFAVLNLSRRARLAEASLRGHHRSEAVDMTFGTCPVYGADLRMG